MPLSALEKHYETNSKLVVRAGIVLGIYLYYLWIKINEKIFQTHTFNVYPAKYSILIHIQESMPQG